jgi:HEAT repeat protein
MAAEGEVSPFERFLASHGEELGVRKVKLQPLGAEDIAGHLQAVFPGVSLPGGLEDELARVTQGNPLFLSEILRKLVMDRKVSLVGQQWRVEILEEGYLPRSLEEIVSEKIAALDEEGRRLLAHVSAWGEELPVSLLTGSTELREPEVLDFIDRADALGLIRQDFQLNDEIVRFLGRRVMEISYGSVERDHQMRLHERVGCYREGLYEQRLLPSASILAYHFKCSDNQEKAQRYEQIHLSYSQSVFNTEEAAGYTGEAKVVEPSPVPEEEPEVEKWLKTESLRLLPHVFRTLLTAIRSNQLYPPDSQPILQAQAKVKDAIDQVLLRNDHLELTHSQGVLLANGQKIDATEYKLLAKSFVELLIESELQGMTFLPGINELELKSLLSALGPDKPDAFNPGFWKRFSSENGLVSINLKQMKYSSVGSAKISKRKSAKGGTGSSTVPSIAAEEKLESRDLTKLPQILRAFLGAAKNVKLYPLGSKPVTTAIAELHASLEMLLSRRPVLTLAGLNQSLLVNGEKVNTSGFETLAGKFLEYIDSVEIVSLTFLKDLQPSDLEMFVGELRRLPAPGMGRMYWQNFTLDKGLTSLAVNERRYHLGVLESLMSSAAEESGQDGAEPDAIDERSEQISEESLETLTRTAPSLGKELLMRGEDQLVRHLLRRLLGGFSDLEPQEREAVVKACGVLLDELILALQYQFTKLVANDLLGCLEEEMEPRVLRAMADVLHRMAASAIQFSDYQMASRMLHGLRSRRNGLEESDEAQAEVLDRKLEATAQKLVSDDLQSGEPARQEKAAQLLGSLGRAGIPLIIEVIKQEKDYRIRYMAATLLAELGPEAAKQIKREVVLEVTAEQRFRVLEIIDTVTSDLHDELAYSLGDVNAKVRRAAFRLAERLNDNGVIDLLIDFARNDDIAVAKGAIRCLVNLRPASAVGALVSILKSAREPELAIACSQALGQLGDPASVDALARILTERRFYVFSRRWNDQVRATAAFALGQISNPRATEVLSRFVTDADPRIRQIVHTAAGMSGKEEKGDEAKGEDEKDDDVEKNDSYSIVD